MGKGLRYALIGFLFLLFVLVRAFQVDFFYDPLHEYFKKDYLHRPLPNLDVIKLFGSYTLRYTVNSIISLAILKLIFDDRSILKTIVGFYILAFVLLSVLFFGMLVLKINSSYLFPFYIRRFLIHPVFILIIFPFVYLLNKRECD